MTYLLGKICTNYGSPFLPCLAGLRRKCSILFWSAIRAANCRWTTRTVIGCVAEGLSNNWSLSHRSVVMRWEWRDEITSNCGIHTMLACSPSFFEHRKEAFLIRPPGQKKGRSTPNLPSTCCYIHIIQASSRTDRHTTTCPPNDISAHVCLRLTISSCPRRHPQSVGKCMQSAAHNSRLHEWVAGMATVSAVCKGKRKIISPRSGGAEIEVIL